MFSALFNPNPYKAIAKNQYFTKAPPVCSTALFVSPDGLAGFISNDLLIIKKGKLLTLLFYIGFYSMK